MDWNFPLLMISFNVTYSRKLEQIRMQALIQKRTTPWELQLAKAFKYNHFSPEFDEETESGHSSHHKTFAFNDKQRIHFR